MKYDDPQKLADKLWKIAVTHMHKNSQLLASSKTLILQEKKNSR